MSYQSVTNSTLYQGQPINTGDQGQFYCFDIILQKIHERLMHMVGKHSRVCFIRFDIHFPGIGYTPVGHNHEISRLFKMLKENARARGIDLHFVWVREQEQAIHPHYHAIALINGAKVQDYRGFLCEVERCWKHVLKTVAVDVPIDARGLIDWCDKDRFTGLPIENGIMIQRPLLQSQGLERQQQEQVFQETVNRCFHWASYLAKVNQKSNTPDGSRRFGVSMIR